MQHEPYPVESKAREILQKLKEGGITRFLLLFRGNRSRSEVVATFLAVLELCKARVLHLAGSGDGLHRPAGGRCAGESDVLRRPDYGRYGDEGN